MSRRRWSRAAAIVVVAVAGAWPSADGSAQLTDRELLERLESLRPELEAAQAAANEANRLRREAEFRREVTRMDTLRVGPVRVLAFPDQAELARGLFDEVWGEHFSHISSSPALEAWSLTFQWRARFRTIRLSLARHVEVSRILDPTRAMAKDRIREAIATVLTEDLPDGSPVRDWLRLRGHPSSERVYRLLAATPSGAHRACLAGDSGACWAALGLRATGASAPLSEWFSPSEQLEMVQSAVEAPWATLDPDDPVVRACVEEGDADSCGALLATRIDWTPGVPLPPEAFAHAFWTAVTFGGEGAWERVLERREASPSEVLRAASGLEPEGFAARWRATLVEARPDVHAGLGTTRWAVLFWTLVLAACAMRSTRWRLA